MEDDQLNSTYSTKWFTTALQEVIAINKESAAMAERVKTGRMKRSELEILARGGRGISRRTKLIARKARKRLGGSV